ncbi:MAG: pyridoxamine 5'-phosphate oxidase family protein [Methylococcales bacterium]|nr:pyridoxamine 5'-phosphate oxidase family protein [Methylococcales bacterium]
MGKFSFRKKGSNKSGKYFHKQKQQVRTETVAGVPEEKPIPDDPDTPEKSAARSKNFALKFASLKDKLKADANTEQYKSAVTSTKNNQTGSAPYAMDEEQTTPEKPTITPGSHGEHLLQEKWGARDRALNFYDRQVLDYLAPKMREFIARQEFLFVATADRNGECDCTSKFGKPGFIRVLSDKYLMYPEYRGNGVFANSGNMIENPHIALLIIDFTRDTVGLHVNGKIRIVANDELLQYDDKLPQDVIEEIHQEGKKCPERWMMIEVEEAYIQCSKHIPLMKKLDKKIDWGTDNVAAKGGDYFQLRNIPLYDRIGGDKAMEVVVNLFYQKVMQDDLVGHFFEDSDMASLRLKQKSFLSMAFGGPYQYSDAELRAIHKPLIEKYGLSDKHFNRFLEIFKETSTELNISANELQGIMEILESTRDSVLNR